MAANLPKLPDVARLSTSVIAVLGGNPNKFTLQGTNTYILGTGPSRILIDTAEGIPVWKDSMNRVLKEEQATVSTCLLTHWHHDHVGGVGDFRSLCPDATLWKGSGNAIDPDQTLTGVHLEAITDGRRFDDGRGFEVEAVFCPGHTQDHTAFVVTRSTDRDEVGAIFTADNVLGHGTAVFEDLATYLRSLDVMKSRLLRVYHQKNKNNSGDKPPRAYPGHGAVIEDAPAKIDEYIEHRRRREEEALNVLRHGTVGRGKEVTAGKEWDSMDMVKVIYWDVPEHLHEPARRGLLMVLAKLKGEGKVVEVDGGRWKVEGKAAL